MREYKKAQAWRERRGLSVGRLAELTGYGWRAIYWMELGLKPPNAASKKPGKVSSTVWQRYRMCCAGVEAQLRGGKRFGW